MLDAAGACANTGPFCLCKVLRFCYGMCRHVPAACARRWNGAELDYNQNDARQTIVNWIDGAGGASAAFDFPTKGILQEAVKNCQYWRLRDENNKPPGVIGYWPEQSVTFIDNHDTGAPANPALAHIPPLELEGW